MALKASISFCYEIVELRIHVYLKLRRISLRRIFIIVLTYSIIAWCWLATKNYLLIESPFFISCAYIVFTRIHPKQSSTKKKTTKKGKVQASDEKLASFSRQKENNFAWVMVSPFQINLENKREKYMFDEFYVRKSLSSSLDGF